MMGSPVQNPSSNWKIWSLGTVTKHKPFGVDIIEVTPHERLSLQSGKPGESTEEYNSSVSSTDGLANTQVLKSKQVVNAIWVPDGDNHLFTSPMVRAGEVVKIFKYADTKEFYWTTIYRSPELRRLERIIYGAGNLSEGQEPLDLDSIYYLEYDTINKSITISTSLSDGERFKYTFCLSPKEDRAWVTDHVGNRFFIDSSTNNVVLEDISGGRYETRDGHPKVTGTKGILLTSPSNVVEGPTVFKDTVRFNSSVNMDSTLTVQGYAHFPGGHGPH